MLTFKAKLGTEFFYDPTLEGDIWITGAPGATVVVVPVSDLMEFSAQAAQVPDHGSEAETDELMRILDKCGVFDKNQSREESRRKLHERMKGRG